MKKIKPIKIFNKKELSSLKSKNEKSKESNLTKHTISTERINKIFKEQVLENDVIKENEIGYVRFTDGHKEAIEYIAKHDENHIRVFTKSGEYLAHKNSDRIFFHDIFYSFDLTWGEDTISDRSRWVVSNDAVKIVIKR